MRLARATFALACRRLTRSLGYRGDSPRRAFAGGIATLVLLDAMVTFLLVERIGHSETDGELVRALLPTAVLVLTYVLAGPVLLLAESTRGRDPSLRRVLETLPVRPTMLWVHLDAPPLAVATLAIGLVAPPAVGALIMAGLPPAAALLAVLSTVGVATATVAVFLTLTRLVLPGARWASVHYPVALLGFTGAIVAVLMSLVAADPVVTTTERLLVLPMVLAEVQRAGSLSVGAGGTIICCAAGVVALALGVSARSAYAERGHDPALRWRLSSRARLVTGDLVCLLRSPSLVSNIAAVLVLDTGLVVLLLRISPATAVGLVNPVIGLMPVMAGIAVRMVRGLFRLVNPPQQLAGASRGSWVWRSNVCAAIVFFATTSPGLLVLSRSDLAAAVDLVQVAGATLGCLGVSLLLSWWLPGTTDDPASQVVAASVYLVAASLVTWAVHEAAVRNAPVALVSAALLVVAALVSGHRVERHRWQPGIRTRR